MSAKETKAPKTATSQVQKVDCSNDSQMVRAGIRPPLLVVNPEWHKKTSAEKAALKKIAKIKDLRPSAPPKILRTLPQRITVHLKNLKKDPMMKTTYSDVIYKDQIYDYLETFFGNMREEVKVIYFGGKKVANNFVL